MNPLHPVRNVWQNTAAIKYPYSLQATNILYCCTSMSAAHVEARPSLKTQHKVRLYRSWLANTPWFRRTRWLHCRLVDFRAMTHHYGVIITICAGRTRVGLVTCMYMQSCRVAGSHLTFAELHRITSSMHRQAGVRLWPSVCRLRVVRTNANTSCRVFSAQTGEPKATPALLDKIKDKDLLKVHGFIGGQWVPASDGTIMEVFTLYLLVSLRSGLGLLNASRPARPCQLQTQVCGAGQESSYRGSYCHSALHEG